jgi:glycosyltransferase involved in cell wall biosynthesis
MKILWVKAGRLLPVDTGGKIRSFNLLRQLARRHHVVVLSYYDGAVDPSYDAALQREFPHAVPMHTGSPTGGPATVWRYLRHLLDHAPYAVTKFTATPVVAFVERAMLAREFDVVVCDFLSATLNFPPTLDTPAVLFQHNVESVLWARQAQHERNPLKRLAFRWEAFRMRRYEQAAVARFHHVIAVSEEDRRLMSSMTPAGKISVAPTGVDLSAFRQVADERAQSPLVVFIGSMDWEPNIDGVEYFCREVWPRVLEEVPEARFRIVGRNPHQRVRRLTENPSVEVTGSVPSITEHLARAAVVVVPLRVGGGTRLKIYEAMAAGRAIVSTTVGAEGLEVSTGEDIVLADTAEAFAQAVLTLLRDDAHRERIAQGAAATAARFDWPVVVRRFEESLERAMTTATTGRTQPAPVSP